MKKLPFFLCSLCILILGCKSKDPLPAEVWSSDCVELAPFEGAYRLTGVCCEYVLLPAIETNKKRTFKVKGSYHSFTGAGYTDIPIEITGNLAPNDTTLTLKYAVNSQENVFVLNPGSAEMKCQCFCY
ncbi:hypothetical protein [Persicitalea jodogahamensis]|uniref:Lipoprotein n=1 Tax=Persicitalea jodogahamensis TaxID=402147 RepID=A0A8J3D276_9BACT|nr:hypothetical protein [Persicitalea jodogahamensis]GHB58947.1 hypothetical protein GCM10007390_10720 [Persicitalea jodogahamensis]